MLTGRSSTSDSFFILQLGPVIRVGDTGPRRVDRRELPPPQVPWRLVSRLGGSPCNEPALIELDHMILSNGAVPGEGHREHVANVVDSLPGLGLSKVVVAVPTWLSCWIGDELKYQLGVGRDLPTGAHYARAFPVIVHAQHPSTKRGSMRG